MLKHDFTMRERDIIIEAILATREVTANKILPFMAMTDDVHLRNRLKTFVNGWYR